MDMIKDIKKRLEEVVCEELNRGIEKIDANELGATIDMIKDLADAMYHCSIVKAMEEDQTRNTTPTLTAEEFRKGAYDYGRMYYTEMPNFGNSGKVRSRYFEHQNSDPAERMEVLEDYLNVLGNDVMEMLENATENEKQIVRSKFAIWSSRL